MNDQEYQKLDETREIKLVDKVLVIKPIDHVLIPLFCPVCHFPFKTADDTIAYRDCQCCNLCQLKFAAPNRDKWEKGWRPSKEDLKPYLEEKHLLSKPLFIIK